MSTYLTDEEQAEVLKKWWRENGKSVIAGTILGLAVIFGWQGWERYQTADGEHASLLYTSMENDLSIGAQDKAVDTAKRLISEHPGSVYATFAALQLAKLSYQKNEHAVAQSHLQWAMLNAPDQGMAGLARLRLARLLMDMQQWDQAKALVEANDGSILSGEFAVLEGDLAARQGNVDAARKAYQRALELGTQDKAILRMKLVDIGEATS